MTEFPMNTVPTLVNVTVVSNMALISFVNRSVKESRFWLSDFIFDKRPRKPIARIAEHPEAGKMCLLLIMDLCPLGCTRLTASHCRELIFDT